MKSSLKKITCVILIVIMIVISVSVISTAYTTDDLTETAIELICGYEGHYATVLTNDNGALSIGRIGWHGTRALELLKSIIEVDDAGSKSLLGTSLYNEIKSSSNWNTRTLTSAEATAIEKCMTSSWGKSIQDKYVFEDIKGYIVHMQVLGITNGNALVFLADVENQGGASVSERVASRAKSYAGSYAAVSLYNAYQAALNDSSSGSSASRRTSAYNYCKALKFEAGTLADSYNPGTYKTTISLNFRSGPGTDYSKVQSDLIPNGTTVTVTEVSGVWGKITYNGIKGWICLDYTTGGQPVTTTTTTTVAVTETTTSGAQSYTTGTYKINVNTLNVRNQAVYGVVLGVVTYGTTLNVTQVNSGWGLISHNGITGWIYLGYADFIAPAQTTAASTTKEPTTAATTAATTVVETTTVSNSDVFSTTTTKADVPENTSLNTEYLMGDVNGNGSVDASDARMALRYSANLDTFTARQCFLADINCDETVSASDARAILRISANLE